MARFTVTLEGGAPWGFRLNGGRDHQRPLTISKVNPSGKAAKGQICIGDTLLQINGINTDHLDILEAQELIKAVQRSLQLVLSREYTSDTSDDNMSVTSTSSSYRIVPNQHDHVIGPPDPNTVTIDDDVINVDGVTLEGFNPANVSVTRTTTRKVTKITRSRSPSPARFSSEGHYTCNAYEESQPDYHNRHGYHVYTSETEEEEVSPPVTIYQGQPKVIRPKPKQAGPPVPPKRGTRPQQYTLGVISTPPNVKVRRYADDLDPGSMSDSALIHVRGRPPLPSRGRSRRRKGRTAIYVQPACNIPSVKPTYSQDDTATVAFSPPPVPPHPESDSEELPRVPPKPHMVKRNVPQNRNDELISYHHPVLTRRTSRGATMFYERQTRHSIDETDDDVFEAPTVQYAQSPKKLVNNNQPITRHEAVMHPAPLTNHSHATMNGTHLSDEWPPPPLAYSQTEDTNSPISNVAVSPKPSSVQVPTPRKLSTTLKPALWSPAKTSSTATEPDEERTLKDMPAVWSPKGDVTKEFKPVKIDLSQPKKVKSPDSQLSSPEEPVPVEKAHNTFTSPPPIVKPAPSVTSPTATVNRVPPTSDSPTPIILPEVPTLPIMPAKPVQNGIVHSPTSESSGPNVPTSPEAPLSPKQQFVSPVTSRPHHVPARRFSNPGVRNVQSSQQAVAKVALITDPSDQSKLELVQMHEVGGHVVHRDRNIHVAPQVQVITDKSKIPKGAVYQKQIIEGEVVHYDTYYPVKETTRTTRTVHTEKPEYSGIGPRDESGLPVGLRQHVKDENRSDWYKQMYKSIHKMDKPEECNPYNPTYSFPDDRKSEDEIVQTLDLFIPAGITCTSTTSANTTTNQHSSLDGGEVVMRRTTRTTPSARADAQKKSNVQIDARNTIDRYQQQPGSILNYVPGKSSLSERERKHSQGQQFNPPPEETQPNFLSKSQTARKLYAPPPNAYTAPQQQTSPKQSSTPMASIDHGAYKQLLQGGYIPGKGLRKTSAEIQQPINSNIAKSPTVKLPKPRSLSSSSSGASAAEQLNVVSAPPQRPPQELRGDVNANYKGTNARDKSSVERVIEEERQKRARQDYENQKSRRHSDNTAVKSPIITDERFGGSKQQHVRSPSHELKAHAIALYSFTAQSPKELSFNKGDTIILTRKIDNNWYEGEQYGRVGIFPVSYVEIITTLEEARTAQISSPTFEGKAKAKFRFTGESAMELGFKKGDYINLTKKVDNNWWEGRIGKKIGIFPAAYVDVIKEPQGNVQPKSPVARQTPSPGRTSPYSPTSTPHRQTSPHGQPLIMQQQQQPQHQQQSYRQPLQNTRSPQSKFVPLASPTYKVNQGSGHGTNTVTKQPQETYRAIFAYTPQNEDELRLEEGDVILVMEKCEDGWYVGTSAKTGQFGTFPGNYVAKFYPD